MAQISFEAYNQQAEEREQRNNQGPRVGYFALKNNGEEAVVRIMHDSVADFDMLVVHPVMIAGKRRNINCLRSPYEPISNCPFCAAEKQLRSKIYIHLIEYTRNQDGTVTATPKLWERSASYATTLKNLIDTYGALSNNIFKIKRNGAAGSMDTTYDVLYMPPTNFPESVYVKDVELFKDVEALGTAVLNRTAEQMQKMLMDEQAVAGSVEPVNTPPSSATQEPAYSQSAVYSQSMIQSQPEPSAPVTPVEPRSYTPDTQSAVDDSGIARPRRYY